jgi:hypothetical protein
MFSKQTKIISTYFTLLLFFFFVEVVVAQSDTTKISATNADIVMSLVGDKLSESSIINNLDTSFRVTAQFPDQQRTFLYDVLLGLNKLILKEGISSHIHLRLFSDNSLNQLNRELAERNVRGELHIHLYDEEDLLQQTEILKFSYSDIVAVSEVDSLESDWIASRFHQKQLLREKNLWRQIGQPAIIAAATGVTVFLLFNVRGS